jgi:bud site selection protein 31
MPLPTKWNQKRKKPPVGFDFVEPILEALENEVRDKVKESNMNQRKIESLWPIHQINWQKSRYIYDLYFTHHRISKEVYQYCINQKLVDAALIAKWKKPGYERLCSTYVINPSNYKFGTTSICRVPFKDRNDDQKYAKDPTTGCMGCASTTTSQQQGQSHNIFGNKYGQNLAAVQIAREKRMERKRVQEEEAIAQAQLNQLQMQQQQQQQYDDDDAETDDDDDYGPTPTAGIWAGSERLQREILVHENAVESMDRHQNTIGVDDDDATKDDDAKDDDDHERPNKKVRS